MCRVELTADELEDLKNGYSLDLDLTGSIPAALSSMKSTLKRQLISTAMGMSDLLSKENEYLDVYIDAYIQGREFQIRLTHNKTFPNAPALDYTITERIEVNRWGRESVYLKNIYFEGIPLYSPIKR
jgi:hypothetical protein|nr:MAG TPA: hypothetical protein [Caudoviricetes sp.]DAQ14670.1 MAG TPA: hypothetical protein [Caudoviricetes sp.]